MTRKWKESRKKKDKGVGGIMIGMRSTVKNVARGAAGAEDEDAPARKKSQWKGMNLFWNVLTAAAAVVAGAVLLKRCGVINF